MKRARNTMLARLSRVGALPAVRPEHTVGLRVAAPPAPIAGAHEFGVPLTAGWFLTLGQGDALRGRSSTCSLRGRTVPPGP